MGGGTGVRAWDPEQGDTDLLALLAEASTGDEDVLRRAADRLAETTLLVPLRGAVDPGPPPDLAALDHTALPVLLCDARQGEVLPLFTRLETLRAWRPGARFIAAPAQDLLRLAGECGAVAVVVDVAGPHPLVLAAGQTGAEVELPPFRDEHFGLTALPAPLPAQAAELLRRELVAAPLLVAAYAVELVDPGGVPHLVLALEAHEDVEHAEAEQAGRELAERLRARVPELGYEVVDVAVLSDPHLHAAVTALDAPLARASQRRG